MSINVFSVVNVVTERYSVNRVNSMVVCNGRQCGERVVIKGFTF